MTDTKKYDEQARDILAEYEGRRPTTAVLLVPLIAQALSDAVKAERERCAKIADKYTMGPSIARAIRNQTD